MAVFELSNGKITVQIDSRGAELVSLQKLSTQTEYMWCGDAKYWNRISPVLFPFVGGVKNRQYRAKGKSYSMTQHGFARDMEFELIARKENEIWMEAYSNEETRKTYPYDFCFQIGYRLTECQAEILWKVINPSQEILYFSIGGHPAFKCPLNSNEIQTDCFIEFDAKDRVISTQISEMGLATDSREVYQLKEGKLSITEDLFDKDALVIEQNQAKEVAFCGKDGKPYVKVSFQAPLFGIWAPAGKKAPFICIEPWYGRCDHEEFEGTLEEREWGNHALPGEAWEASYTIEV